MVLLLFASLASITALYFEAWERGGFSFSMTVRFVGLALVLAFGWYGIPMLTHWTRRAAERARTPFEWRLLNRGHAIRRLSAPTDNRWLRHENPRDGLISAAMANQLLSPIEAEAILSFTKPRGSKASELLIWRTYDAPRLSRVLEAKARLIGQNRDDVKASDVYDWIDFVVKELVGKSASRRTLDSTPIAVELLEARIAARARRALWLGFWQSPAGLFATILAFVMGAILVALLYPAFQSFFDQYPSGLAWGSALFTVAATPVATQLVAVLFRKR